MYKTMVKFMSDDKGLETVEYALMAALVVAGIAAAVTALSGAVTTSLGNATAAIGGK